MTLREINTRMGAAVASYEKVCARRGESDQDVPRATLERLHALALRAWEQSHRVASEAIIAEIDAKRVLNELNEIIGGLTRKESPQ